MSEKILVLSDRHYLLPFANRMTRDGHSVEVALFRTGSRGRYEEAYSGALQLITTKDDEEREIKLQSLQELAEEGQVTVITNSYMASRQFSEAQRLFPSIQDTPIVAGALRLGAWVRQGQLSHHHLLLVDEGFFPGGFGAAVDTGLTMMPLDAEAIKNMELEEILPLGSVPKDFSGLAQWNLQLRGERFKVDGWFLGWPFLQTHAFFSETEDMAGFILEETEMILPRYTVALILSLGPWPNLGASTQHSITGISEEAMAQHIYWHDVRVDQEAREISTGGLDGLVAVVRASAHSFELARHRALTVAHTVQYPGKQFRSDVGHQVQTVLGMLEDRLGLEIG